MRNRKLDLSVGQEVIIADTNDGIRYLKNSEGVSLDNIDRWTNKGIIIKIARKYITVSLGRQEKRYDKEFNYVEKSEYGSYSKLYLSLAEIREEWESEVLYNSISDSFSKYSYDNKCELTLNQLKRIKVIIEVD